jgi:hypothetical protein
VDLPSKTQNIVEKPERISGRAWETTHHQPSVAQKKGWLACPLRKPANLNSNDGQAGKPTVYKNIVVLTYCDRHLFVQPAFYKPAVHMKRVEIVLNA